MQSPNALKQLLALLAVLALALPAAAQFTTAALNGTITDPSGAAVPDAGVIMRNMETNFTQSTATGPAGSFAFPRLPVGRYALRVEKAGFSAYTQEGITLTVSQTATQDVALQVGGTASQITVNGEASLVTTATAEVGHVVDERRIVDLPLDGRNAQALVFLAPGSVDVTSRYCGYNCMGGVYPNEQQAAVNGSGPMQVDYRLDGVNHNDTFLNMNLPFPNPDAVQEFSVQTNNLSAEYGSAGSGAINIVTKSGTNQIHGDVFEFLRNGSMNARNYFGSAPDTLKRNQFGGGVGGPIVKDHLFYFATYQGTRMRYASTSQFTFVPTAAERAGDFSADSADLKDPVTGDPFVGNRIPAEKLNPVSKYLLDRIPLPNAGGRRYNFTSPLSKPGEDQYMGKVDWNHGRQQLNARFFYSQFDQPAVTPADNLILSDGNGTLVTVQNVGVNHTFTVSPNLLANTAFGYSSQTGGNFSSAPFGLPQAGQKLAVPKQPEISIGVEDGFNIFTNHKGDFDRSDWSVRENVTWMNGTHELHLGGEAVRVINQLDNQYLQSGQFYFQGAMSGDSMADFILGRVNWFMQAGGERKDMVGTRWGFFAQDNWRVKPRLTINMGLRWDPFLPYSEVDGRTACFAPGQQSSRYPNAPAGLVYGGEPGCPEHGVNSYLPAFAPRLGFAYRLTQDGKTSIRAGAGLYYSAAATDLFYYHGNAPFAPFYGMPSVDFTDPWGSKGRVSPFPGAYAANVPDAAHAVFSVPVQLSVVDQNWRPGRVASWNLAVERQIVASTVARVMYVGNKASHLSYTVGWPAERDLNAPIYNPSGDHWDYDSRRPYQNFSSINTLEPSNNSRYDALQIEVERRMTRGISLLASYTHSRTLDDYNWLDPFSRTWNWGPSNDSIPNNFKLSNIWDLPKSKLTGVPGAVLNGWSLNSIVNWRSGFPITVYAGSDNSWTGIWGDRGDWTPGNPNLSMGRSHQQLVNKFFDTSLYKTNAEGTFGNSPKNLIAGPRLFQTDLVLAKAFRIAEAVKLNFRAEAFNAFNNVNFKHVNNNVDIKKRFGTIDSAYDPRILQLALKLSF